MNFDASDFFMNKIMRTVRYTVGVLILLYVGYVMFGFGVSHAGGRGRVVPDPTPTASASPTPRPSPSFKPVAGIVSPKVFVTLGEGASASMKPGGEDSEYVAEALGYINLIVSSGCFAEEAMRTEYFTLEKDIDPQLRATQNLEALKIYFAKAPYALDLRWYQTWSNVIGYTYFYRDNIKSKGSETRIWTNWRNIGDSDEYATHIMHETSHQARAGAFGHWSRHAGSFPYRANEIAERCLRRLYLID